MKIKKGDTVKVKTGKDRGKQGEVTQVFPREQSVVVNGVNVMKRHLKGKNRGEGGQILEFNAPIAASKLQLVCSKCGKVTRIGYRFSEDKKDKERVCKKCDASL